MQSFYHFNIHDALIRMLKTAHGPRQLNEKLHFNIE